MNYPDPHETAGVVLAAASRIDGRTGKPDPQRLSGWAELFADYPMSHDEAAEAVRRHYLKPAAAVVLPGDVIAIVKDLRGVGDRFRTGIAATRGPLDASGVRALGRPVVPPNPMYRAVADELAARRVRRLSTHPEGDTAS